MPRHPKIIHIVFSVNYDCIMNECDLFAVRIKKHIAQNSSRQTHWLDTMTNVFVNFIYIYFCVHSLAIRLFSQFVILKYVDD